MKRTLLSMALLSAFGLSVSANVLAVEVTGNSSLSQIAPDGTVTDGLHVKQSGVLDGANGELSVSGLAPSLPPDAYPIPPHVNSQAF